MFKYLKTLNNDSHPSEIYSFISPAGDDNFAEVKSGTIVSVTFGEISPTYTSATPLYLAISSKKKTEEAYVKCLRLAPGMVLEADIDPESEPTSFFIGAICDAMEDITGKGAFLTRDGQTVFEIIDISNIENGKVSVVII